MIGTGFKENKDTLIEKTSVYTSFEMKGSEAKSWAWAEADFLASMLMTRQDLLTFKFVEKTLNEGDSLQSAFI